ncbi:MAG: lamin tail domain-containing protein [Dehalococcoidia bacterium]|nr:lamin tail domain-containing protein [Dehalococcoidia bacterium]
MERHVRGWLGMVMAAAVLFVAATPTRASELLANPGFDSWTGSAPTGWLLIGATANEAPGAAGSAARIEATGPARVVQSVPVTGGATYAAAILVQADQPGVTVSLQFMSPPDDAGITLHPVPASSAFQAVSFSAVAPPQATSARLVVEMTPPGGSLVVLLDSASLTESAPPPPTATPTDPPTPAPGTPIPTATATTTATSPATPPKSVTSTKTPTATAGTATATRPPGTATPAPVSTPKPPKDLPPGIPSGFGGLVLNGDFELLDDDVPAYWSKVGGELALEPGAFRGNAAGAIDSSTSSTKWLYQVVPVSGGTWFAASGQARIRWGNGEAWLRVSWYASGDGSGREMDQADSPSTTAVGWQPLATGAVLAPGGANSARVRLMLRPEPGFASVAFDDVVFAVTTAPTATATASPARTATPTPATASPGPATPPPVARPPGNAATATATSTVAGVIAPGPAASPAPAFVVQPVAGPLSLRISELLADPAESGRDAPFEWVELVNVGAEPVDLAGWTIADGAGSDVLPSAVVPPGGFVVIAGRDAQFPGIPIVRVPDGEIGGGLNNGGDTVRLLAPGGDEVDSISFGDDRSVFDPAPPAPPAGSTLGVIAAGADPAPENWAITSAPTPGAPNTFPPPARDAAEATATSAPQGIVSAPGAATQPAGAPDATFEDGTKDGSAIPWILLGGSIGGSAAAVAIAGWQRIQRRKGGPRGGD